MDDNREFFQSVRGALNHLYDPEYLAKSPLRTQFGLREKYDPASALQQCLIRAIEALRPQGGSLLAERDQQAHDLLLYRYVQRLTQDDIAHQFGVSERQLRRDQNRAVQLLAGRLWEQFGLAHERSELAAPSPDHTAGLAVNESFAWLVQNPSERLTDPNQILVTVVELAQALAGRYAVHLTWAAPPDLPPVAVHPVAFRQILIALLSHTMQCAAAGQCMLSVAAEAESLVFEVAAQWPDATRSPRRPDFAQIEELIALFHGQLVSTTGPSWLNLRLRLPICEQSAVLVIDDNPDILQLLQRYAAGTRYQVIGAQDPGRAFELLETRAPRIIILDVMMPRVDGWELLRKLRSHPITGRLPIAICTIMNQPELAYALGANAFLRKPITQTAFLEALDRLAAAPGSGSS
jgi:CheY-like chemotaxis protein